MSKDFLTIYILLELRATEISPVRAYLGLQKPYGLSARSFQNLWKHVMDVPPKELKPTVMPGFAVTLVD